MAQKVSLVITTKNEQNHIVNLLNNILSQSLQPKETIIVDGGSTDETVNNIHKWVKSNEKIKKWNLKLIIANKANRSQGRNIGIKESQHNIIALTDSGCILDDDWLYQITLPLRNIADPSDYVFGSYQLVKKSNSLSYCAGLLTFNAPSLDNPNTFLPSARSVAINKQRCKQYSYFPSNLHTAEDLVWGINLRNNPNLKGAISNSAIVYWSAPKSLSKIIKTFYNYAKGDGESNFTNQHYINHWIKILLTISTITFSLVNYYALSGLILIAFLWTKTFYKAYSKTRNISDKITLLILIPILYFTTSLGFTNGFINKIMRKYIHG